MTLADRLVRFSQYPRRANWWSAFLAGTIAAFIDTLIYVLNHSLTISKFFGAQLAGVACFLTVATVLNLRDARPSPRAPRWILIALLGSSLFIASGIAPSLVKEWLYGYHHENSAHNFWTHETFIAGYLIAFYVTVTVPITWTVSHIPWIVKRSLAWKERPTELNIYHDHSSSEVR